MAVNQIGVAKLYWIAAPDVAKRASTLATVDGGDAFPAMSAIGGEMANLPAIVRAGCRVARFYLLDASGIAADGGPVTVSSSGRPYPDGHRADDDADGRLWRQTVSMCQDNSHGFSLTACFGAQLLRDDAVAVIESISWGGA